MEKKKFKLGLLPKLLIAIVLGIIIGPVLPGVVLPGRRHGIQHLQLVPEVHHPADDRGLRHHGHCRLEERRRQAAAHHGGSGLRSTLIAGSASYLVSAKPVPPAFMSEGALEQIAATADNSLVSYISISIPPLLDTLSAVVLAFVLGLCMSTLRGKTIGDTLYNGMKDFSGIIDQVLHSVIIPLLPLYVCGTFIDMTKSGKTYAILSILWKVFLVVIIMHLVCIFLQFCVAGAVSHKSPFKMIRNQIPGYTTALGTQSSAATIPVNLQCAAADGVSEQIRNFVVPLCANIHMAGSMITITACATAVCLMNQLPISLATVVPFIMTLGVAMVASPGAPGGSIMTALPFLYMIFGAEAGDPNGPICAIMVALYITQDSFGTACNVSGDNAIGVIVETIYQKFINKSSASV